MPSKQDKPVGETLEQPRSPVGEVSRLAERLFRDEAGKLVATLTRLFGVNRLQLSEDVVQEALAKALRVWPYYGIPENPAGWLTQTAKNLALDTLRREKTFLGKEAAITASFEQDANAGTIAGAAFQGAAFEENEIRDDQLRMLFVCCHPVLAQEAQVALALKTLCGFSTLEIAKAFLSTEASIAKRLSRAKQRLREGGVPFEIPTGPELCARLEAVLQTLYLLFNEGYKASGGERLVREELCWEAIRLMLFMIEHPVGNQPAAHALLALMLLNAARLATRSDEEGNLMQLAQQDRNRWDRKLIAGGMAHLTRSATGDEITEYHVQAGIAACHCTAADYASTDWKQILSYYDRLVRFNDSPIVALNRAVAVSNVRGPGAGLAAVAGISNVGKLKEYYLYYAVQGEFEFQLKQHEKAAGHFRKALELAELKSEQAFLEKKVRSCRGGS